MVKVALPLSWESVPFLQIKIKPEILKTIHQQTKYDFQDVKKVVFAYLQYLQFEALDL